MHGIHVGKQMLVPHCIVLEGEDLGNPFEKGLLFVDTGSTTVSATIQLLGLGNLLAYQKVIPEC